jgi:hypothetical protein
MLFYGFFAETFENIICNKIIRIFAPQLERVTAFASSVAV